MVTKFSVYFDPAGQERRIHLYLPNDYERSQERYPVLYMYDGHNLFFDSDATFGKSLGLKSFLDGWAKKLIVVGMECAMEDRVRVEEYCPYHIHSYMYGEIDGRGSQTVDWIVNRLKPLIDSRYRTIPFRECTAIAGYSMGGMMALYTVLHQNRYFSKAAVISPSVQPAMSAFQQEIWKDSLSPDTRIFFSWGTGEGSADTVNRQEGAIRYLESEIQKKGVQTYLFRNEGGQHNEQSWEHEVPTWMSFLWF